MSENTNEIQIRNEKLQELIKKGVNPYPAAAHEKTDIKKAREMDGKIIWVAGRIISARGHGKTLFADIADDSGKIQAYFKQNIVGDKKYELLNFLDESDIVEVHGEIFITKMGEKTIKVDDFNFLAKSLLPLPGQWYGIKDVELRYRKRTLDFIVNEKTKEIIKTRAKIIQTFRKLMEEEGFIEVETPIFQPIPGGAAAKPFITHHNILDHDFYLRISPELYLKRMISGGFEKIFEIGRCFRNEGLSHMHNPEFTMFEFYWAYKDHLSLMDFTEKLIPKTIKAVTGSEKIKYQNKELDFRPPYPRFSLRELILKDSNIDINIHKDLSSLKKEIQNKKIDIDLGEIKVWVELVDELYKKVSRPKIIQPVFVTDYPASLVPLAKTDSKTGKTAQIFQLVAGGGMEIIKAYSELNNPLEQEEKMREQVKMREAGWEEGMYLDKNYIEALSHGMPPTAGWGLGIDRFIMLITDNYSIKEVIAFPTLKPTTDKTD